MKEQPSLVHLQPETQTIIKQVEAITDRPVQVVEVADLPVMAKIKIASERAHKNLRGAVAGGMRMDVVMYLADALQKFSGMNRREVSHITLEIAMLGRSGLDINDPDRKYRLKTLPGEFSWLHLLAIMHAGVRMFDPKADTGADFDKEYAMAKTMAGKA